MFSLNDTAATGTKIKTPENKTNNNQTISISETSVVRVEISEPLFNTVHHQTISLPRESIYQVRSHGKITSEEDVLNIQISNVRGATADQAKNKVLFNQNENHTDKLSNQQMQPAFHAATQREIPLVKRSFGGKLMNFNQIAKHVDKSGEKRSKFEVDFQTKSSYTECFPGRLLSKDMTTEKKRYQVDPNMPCPANQSSILNGEPLAESTGIRKKLATKLNSHEPEIWSSYHHLSPQPSAMSQPSNAHHKSSAYQMSTNDTISAYHGDTTKALYTHPQHGGTESVSSHQVSDIRPPPYFHMSSNGTVPLYHMDETTTAQAQDGEMNASYQASYYPEMSKYFDNNIFNAFQQRMPFWPTENHNMVPNHQMTACSCSCSCNGRRESHHYENPITMKNQRPSVIMVPVSWSSCDSGISHLPLKVDATAYKLHCEEHLSSRENVADRMEYSDDSDSSDDDGENGKEKYFRQNIDGTTAVFKLTKEDWERIPIKTFPSGGRLLSGDWTRIFLSKVKESNPWCSLRFKNNHVRSENSRKIHSAVFFRGGAECKRPECNVKVRFVIRKEKGKHVDVTYVGDVCHDSQPGVNDVTSDNKTINRFRRTYST